MGGGRETHASVGGTGTAAVPLLEPGNSGSMDVVVAIGSCGGRGVGGAGRGRLSRTSSPGATLGLATAVSRGALDAIGDSPVLDSPLGGALGVATRRITGGRRQRSGILQGLLAFSLDEALWRC